LDLRGFVLAVTQSILVFWLGAVVFRRWESSIADIV